MALHELLILATAVIAGLLGSMLGMGGGTFLVPIMTLFLGVPIRLAIGASIVSVIATSSASAAKFVKARITNIRIGIMLETGATLGALSGAYLVGILHPSVLFLIFGIVLLISTYQLILRRSLELPEPVTQDSISKRLCLSGSYYDTRLGFQVDYRATGAYKGWLVLYVAGALSALLGIGAGLFKVLGMDIFMKLPMKVSTATSNFMIGITAAASAGLYFARGDIDPAVAAPTALGVLMGASVGPWLTGRMKSTTIRTLFIPVLVYVGVTMMLKGMGVLH